MVWQRRARARYVIERFVDAGFRDDNVNAEAADHCRAQGKPTGPHRERREERATDGRRNLEPRIQGSGHQRRDSRRSRGERRKADTGREAANQPATESGFKADLSGQAQREHGALRKQCGWPAPRKPAGPHRPGNQERAAHRGRDRQTRESAEGHQPAGEGGPRGKRRKVDTGREEANQQRAERRFEEHLQQKAQRQHPGGNEEVSHNKSWITKAPPADWGRFCLRRASLSASRCKSSSQRDGREVIAKCKGFTLRRSLKEARSKNTNRRTKAGSEAYGAGRAGIDEKSLTKDNSHSDQDPRFRSHYSLWKTIEAAFALSYLGHAADATTNTLALDACPFATTIELRARTASFKWQVSPLLLYSLPWHRARTEPSRKVSCQSAYCRATLFGGSREKCFAFRSRSVDGTEYVTGPSLRRLWRILHCQLPH